MVKYLVWTKNDVTDHSEPEVPELFQRQQQAFLVISVMSYIISFITHVSLCPALLLNSCCTLCRSAWAEWMEENSKWPSQTLLSTGAKPSSPQLLSGATEQPNPDFPITEIQVIRHCWLICVDKLTCVKHNQNLMVGIAPWLLEGSRFIC